MQKVQEASNSLMVHIASSQPGAWIMAHTLHHIDRFSMKLSGGKWSFSSLVSGLLIVCLSTIGAKSGERREVPLIAIPSGSEFILIASNWGQSKNPGWYYNLRANREINLSVNGRMGEYMAQEVSGEERERYWQAAVSYYPGYAIYAGRANGRQIPVMVLIPKEPGTTPA